MPAHLFAYVQPRVGVLMTQCRLAPNLILCGNETYRTRRARHGGARKILDSCTRHSMHRYPSSLKSCSATTLAAARNARLRILSLMSVSSNKLSDIGLLAAELT